MYRQKDRHQQRMILAAAAAALLPLAAACGSERADGGGTPADAGETPVTGVHWKVDSVTVDGTTHRAPQRAHLTIDAGGRAEGSLGCNRFTARATVDGDRVRLSDATATEMACDDIPMAVEEALSRTLTAGPLTTGAEGDRLTLTAPGGDTVRLSRHEDAPLYGTKWTVTGPGGGAGRAHLTFDDAGDSVSGRLGCNSAHARATVRDGHITLGAPVTTRMMCEDSLMDTEKRLLKLFESPLRYRIDQQTLTLTSENGQTVRAVADR
ncbi:META domain-containing protein [Streptomyces sp. PRKS01-65]|nr:META domain-containing protein [Streptomyces harenosi]NEY34871.1 META domain-containing protein [Streptomyces harenosi]